MIDNIRIGIKISTRNLDFIPEIYSNQGMIDFIEIILMPEFTVSDINTIKNLRIPYAIHLPNSNYGIDFGDPDRNTQNIDYIEKINQFGEHLSPICYIVHPESGDVDLSIENIKKLNLDLIAIENMPKQSLRGGELLGYSPESLRIYFQRIENLEFCFDINHAIKAALSENIKYASYIKGFLELKSPIIFHLSGGNYQISVDEHLDLDVGNYNISIIKNILLDLKYTVNLTLETPKNYEKKIQDDLRNIEIFLKA